MANTNNFSDNSCDRCDNGRNAVAEARRVTWIGFWINAILGLAKVIGGIFGRSSALVADGIHSFSDFLSDIIVIVMIGIARKQPDVKHQFGHGHYEALATVILSLALMIVAIGILDRQCQPNSSRFVKAV